MNILLNILTLAICINYCDLLNATAPINQKDSTTQTEQKKIPEANKATQVSAKHILVDKLETAQKIKKDIIENKISFEKAAETYSTCPSKNQGGDLGPFKRGQMVNEFEDVAFSLELEQISDPIKTDHGWHLIKVYDRE